MTLGVLLFLFLAGLLLVSISPLSNWRLDEAAPLDEDDLEWPAAGYGSASISLNGLFSAYTASLLLVGVTCFAGVVAGVISGLVAINWWSAHSGDGKSFQQALYQLTIFESPAIDRAFWFLIVFCQLGLALSELVLLHHVFAVGLGLSTAHAIVASLCIASVAYYYCLAGGYHAVFRTDALQYLMILFMGGGMLYLAWRSGGLPAATASISAISPAAAQEQLIPAVIRKYPTIRAGIELLAGFALGIMPVLPAPDAWKRVRIVLQRNKAKHEDRYSGRTSNALGSFSKVRHFSRVAPVRLLLATAVPIALVTTLLLAFPANPVVVGSTFPLRAIFAASPPILDSLILLGMTAAFMSTFDSALLTATHLMLKQKSYFGMDISSELQRFRILLGAGFAMVVLLLIPIVGEAPNPYVVGAFMIGPFALASGSLLGTNFGRRKVRGMATPYLAVALIFAWLLLAADYVSQPETRDGLLSASKLVFAGCFMFFLTIILSRATSTVRRSR